MSIIGQNLGIDPNYLSQYQQSMQNYGLGQSFPSQLQQLNAPNWNMGMQVTFMADGKKPLVVCNGEVTEAKDMDDAQRIAEEKAHQKGANAYILKPVKQVAPKRDVVTTDL